MWARKGFYWWWNNVTELSRNETPLFPPAAWLGLVPQVAFRICMQWEKAEHKQVIIDTLLCIRSRIRPALTECSYISCFCCEDGEYAEWQGFAQRRWWDWVLYAKLQSSSLTNRNTDVSHGLMWTCWNNKMKDIFPHFSCLGTSLCMQEACLFSKSYIIVRNLQFFN